MVTVFILGEIDPGRTSLGSESSLNWLGLLLDLMMDIHAEVGVDTGVDNWDFLFLFSFFAADDDEDDSLALAFLFHRGVQMTLLDDDGDEDCSCGILVFGGVLGELVNVGDGGVPPTAPSSCCR